MGQTQIARVTLLESDARKSAFLSTVIRELNLSADVRVLRKPLEKEALLKTLDEVLAEPRPA